MARSAVAARAGSRMSTRGAPLGLAETHQAILQTLHPARPWLGERPACAASADPACSGAGGSACILWLAARSAPLSPSSASRPRRGMSGHQGGPLGSATRLPGSCCCIASFLASSAGPARSQVGICAGLLSGPLAGHLATSRLCEAWRDLCMQSLERPCKRESTGLHMHQTKE